MIKIVPLIQMGARICDERSQIHHTEPRAHMSMLEAFPINQVGT